MLEINNIYCGDALELIKKIDTNSIDAVITDPPYLLNVISVIQKKGPQWADIENAAIFYSVWFKEVKRILKNTGYFLCFGTMKTLPAYIKALYLADMQLTNVLIWDKNCLGTGSKKQFRTSYEIIIVAGMENAIIENRSIKDIINVGYYQSQMAKYNHPSEKPEKLLEILIETVTHENDLILDPFAGSGTTLKAAKNLKRNFIGFEMDKKWCDVIKNRLEE